MAQIATRTAAARYVQGKNDLHARLNVAHLATDCDNLRHHFMA